MVDVVRLGLYLLKVYIVNCGRLRGGVESGGLAVMLEVISIGQLIDDTTMTVHDWPVSTTEPIRSEPSPLLPPVCRLTKHPHKATLTQPISLHRQLLRPFAQ